MTDLPDDETLLSRFRQWLQQVRAEADAIPAGPWPPPPVETEDREVGLYRLFEAFTALRHEVKLQTKGSRDLQERTEALLPALQRAIEQFRSVEPKEAQAVQAACKPMAEALADLDEALDRGRVEIEKARHRIAEGSTRSLEADLDDLFHRQSRLRRWLLRGYHEQARDLLRQRDREARPVALIDALREGYGLILARLRRVMEAEQVHRIEAPGRPVDPERMTVVEVVDAPGQPPGTVVDEVRRGYTWRGRVLRFAEVRAARSPAASASDEASGNGQAEHHEIQDRSDAEHGNHHRD